jgi:hypothetical protein
MKEDILEQLAEGYLQAYGYFTRHNVKFQPRKDHAEFSVRDDCVSSDIDVLGVNPNRNGVDRVWVVSCKSGQAGFNIRSKLTELQEGKVRSGRKAWKGFRELMNPKWSDAFCDAVSRETGSKEFTYITAVTKLSGDKTKWEGNPKFREALHGNPVRIVSLAEMIDAVLPQISTTVASSDFGRTLQLLKASGVLGGGGRGTA